MMTADGQERMLHDYIDGRLSAEERERFETRLREDPALARRVATLRELGRSLREGDEDLSPGFYTRARAAFEETSGRRARSRWFRPLSWEMAGLAAAVLVAAAIYLPHLLRSPLQREPWKASEAQRAETAASEIDQRRADSGALGEVTAEAQAPALPVPREKQAPDTAARPKKGAAEAGAAHDKLDEGETGERWAPAPGAEAPADEAPAPPAAGARDADSEARTGVEERYARAAARPAPAASESKTKLQAEAQAEAEEAYRKAEEVRRAVLGARARSEVAADRPAAVALPSGLVAPGALRVVDDPQEWDALLAGPAGESIAALGGYDPRSRLVLIGARPEPFDCSRVSIVTTEIAHRILLSPPSADGRAAEHGCAVLVPRDGRAIELVPGGRD